MTIEPKPCPWCGGRPWTRYRAIEGTWSIGCCAEMRGAGFSEADAVAAWNGRMPTDEVAAWNDALGYAQRLAKTLVAAYYPNNTAWRVQGDMMGVLLQIDNAIAGIANFGALRERAEIVGWLREIGLTPRARDLFATAAGHIEAGVHYGDAPHD